VGVGGADPAVGVDVGEGGAVGVGVGAGDNGIAAAVDGSCPPWSSRNGGYESVISAP